MNEAFNALQTVSHKMAEALYSQTGSTPDSETATDQSSAASASSSSSGGEENVIDAEYVDVDEDKK
jgi:molecular chaperone DnaK